MNGFEWLIANGKYVMIGKDRIFNVKIEDMEEYARYYHEQELSKLHQPTVISRFCEKCGNSKMLQGNGIIEPLCTCDIQNKT